jgi:hypothetical protein
MMDWLCRVDLMCSVRYQFRSDTEIISGKIIASCMLHRLFRASLPVPCIGFWEHFYRFSWKSVRNSAWAHSQKNGPSSVPAPFGRRRLGLDLLQLEDDAWTWGCRIPLTWQRHMPSSAADTSVIVGGLVPERVQLPSSWRAPRRWPPPGTRRGWAKEDTIRAHRIRTAPWPHKRDGLNFSLLYMQSTCFDYNFWTVYRIYANDISLESLSNSETFMFWKFSEILYIFIVI